LEFLVRGVTAGWPWQPSRNAILSEGASFHNEGPRAKPDATEPKDLWGAG